MKKRAQQYRLAVQVFFFLLVALIAVNHTLAESGMAISWFSSASVHAICPFGGVESFYQLVTTGDMIQKIRSSAFVLMGIVFTLTLLFGPVFCGWICPLGSIQEWVGSMGRALFGKRYNTFVPQKLDKVLRYLRYVLLALVLYNTAMSGMLLFANVDPYYALFHFWTGETAIASLVILGITLGLSLFVERAWCKYACPYGAMLGLFNPIRIFKIKRNESSCISCGLCDQSCPMNISVSTTAAVTDHQCISCLKCTSETSCPVKETVGLELFYSPVKVGQSGQHMEGQKSVSKKSVKAQTLAIFMLVLMFGGIASTSALGGWSTAKDQGKEEKESSEISSTQEGFSSQGQGAVEGAAGNSAVETEEHLINGQISFYGLLDLGLTEAEIESVIGGEMPAQNILVRSYCQENGLSFSEVKATLTEILLAKE